MLISVGGCDPSLNNFGMVKGVYDTDSKGFIMEQMNLLSPSLPKTKSMLVNARDYQTASLLSKGLNEFLGDCEMVFVELPTGSKSARSAASYGMCLGIFGSFTHPIIVTSAREAKYLATGNSKATKKEMIQWATNKYPNASWLRQGQRITNANEHLADALASVEAGIRTYHFLNYVNTRNTI